MKPRIGLLIAAVAIGVLLIVTLTAGLLAQKAMPAPETAAAGGILEPGVIQWGFLAAAIAAGLATLGAGYAVGMVGSAAVGALAEKPELLGRVLILVGLAEGIAIYGLIVAILILNRTA